jgi:hypothetical protein
LNLLLQGGCVVKTAFIAQKIDQIHLNHLAIEMVEQGA